MSPCFLSLKQMLCVGRSGDRDGLTDGWSVRAYGRAAPGAPQGGQRASSGSLDSESVGPSLFRNWVTDFSRCVGPGSPGVGVAKGQPGCGVSPGAFAPVSKVTGNQVLFINCRILKPKKKPRRKRKLMNRKQMPQRFIEVGLRWTRT